MRLPRVGAGPSATRQPGWVVTYGRARNRKACELSTSLPEDTTPVRFEVLGVEPVGRGRLIALANVAVEIEGVAFKIQGLRVVRGAASPTVEAPQWRHPVNGRWLPALLLPADLRDAIAAEVLAGLT